MKSLIRLVLVLAIGVILGYVFQPTIDKKLAEKSPKVKTYVMNRQGDWNAKLEEKIENDSTKTE